MAGSALADPRFSAQLLTASGKGLIELVRMLLERGADTRHARASDGWTALMAACSSGHLATAEVLIEHGADIAAIASDGYSALFEACAGGHTVLVSLLLGHRADPLAASPDGTSPLILASLRGHDETVALLLERRADAAHAKRCGFSAFRAACANGHASVARRLLPHRADVGGSEGAFALVSACGNGHVAVTRLLLESGVSPNAVAADGTSALLQACMANHREVAALLIRHDADLDGASDVARRKNLVGVRRVLNELRKTVSRTVNETRDLDMLVHSIEQLTLASRQDVSSAGLTQQDRVAESSSTAAVTPPLGDVPAQQSAVFEVRAHAADVSLSGHVSDTIVMQMQMGTGTAGSASLAPGPLPPEIIREELSNVGAGEPNDVARSVHSGTSASSDPNLSKQLLTASSKGLAELAELFLKRGADPNYTREVDGWTPLIAACSGGHFAVAETLLAGGSAVHAIASDGFTPLLEACANGHETLVSLLLRHGARVPQASNDGTTALILASLHGHVGIVSLLLEHKADAKQSRSDGFTALRAACGNGNAAVARILLDHGGDSAASSEGVAALMSSCANGHVVVARTLIERGVCASSAADDGTTALMQACIAGHHEVAAMLISHGASIEQALDAARQQNSLSGVKRVLVRARPLTTIHRPPFEESRNIDDLVREIEGREQSLPSVRQLTHAGGSARLGAVFRAPALATTQQPLTNDGDDRSSSSSAASSSSMLLRLAENNRKQQEAVGKLAAARVVPKSRSVAHHSRTCASPSSGNLPADPLSAPAPGPTIDIPGHNGMHEAHCLEQAPETRSDGACTPRVLARHLPPTALPGPDPCDSSRWSLRVLSAGVGNRAPGTFYTIEVLCEDSDGATQEEPRLACDGTTTSEAAGRASRQNAAVVSARCRGWPVAELSLIPYNEFELAEAARLAEGGIARVAAASAYCGQGQCPSPGETSRSSSTPRSLPDRDAPETYLAWCMDMQRRHSQASLRGAGESRRCGLIAF